MLIERIIRKYEGIQLNRVSSPQVKKWIDYIFSFIFYYYNFVL